ncbi:hypothetical protein JW707_04320 [Candidatus Woesearchaeota archaeon]|nr:hypothetical protein [Candidatus Woesearchaeota archaeon]
MGKDFSKQLKKGLKNLWWFIWESNSIWSWIANIILAFVIIKFLLYPGLGFMVGTTHPVVAVISSSMEHNGKSVDSWWSSECCMDIMCTQQISQETLYFPYLITKNKFEKFKFKNGFNKGDIMILVNPKNAEVGDIIVFYVQNRADPIIHRIVYMNETSYSTKGDNNCGTWEFEADIPKEKAIGKAVLRIPLLGWIKIGFMNLVGVFAGG